MNARRQFCPASSPPVAALADAFLRTSLSYVFASRSFDASLGLKYMIKYLREERALLYWPALRRMIIRKQSRGTRRGISFQRRFPKGGNGRESITRTLKHCSHTPNLDTSRGIQGSESAMAIPAMFSSRPVIQDKLETETSLAQDRVVDVCLPFLNGDEGDQDRNPQGIPHLNRASHEDFLAEFLEDPHYLAFDPQRTWVLYWNLTALSILGSDTTIYGSRVVELVSALQRPEGGIGGGPGHSSHALPTYAAVLSCAIIGPSALDCFNRKTMWQWLGRLKQADGGFAVGEGAEVDVRGLYCSMTVITLLNLPLDLPPDAPARAAGLTSFLDNVETWLSRSQTYEGGIAGAPGTEAHGSYAFCALACACLLGPPQEILPRCFDMPSLIHWLSARQYAPEGGFSGRTNKLVDGCYSHWVGGCWPLIQVALPGADDFYSREGLVRYILTCCQQPQGGLRDKPTTFPDCYHSCYVLSGLSSAQHRTHFADPSPESTVLLPWAFGWKTAEQASSTQKDEQNLLSPEDLVEPIHPIFVIPFTASNKVHDWCLSKQGF